jgi:hypothetical protein
MHGRKQCSNLGVEGCLKHEEKVVTRTLQRIYLAAPPVRPDNKSPPAAEDDVPAAGVVPVASHFISRVQAWRKYQ